MIQNCQHTRYADYRHCRVHVILAAIKIKDWWDYVYRIDKIVEFHQKLEDIKKYAYRWHYKTSESLKMGKEQRELYLQRRCESHYRPMLEPILSFYEVPLELIPIITQNI
jgi:hypothetical protein